MKKKSKRVDSRQGIADKLKAVWFDFRSSGAMGFVLLLAGYVLCSSIILAFQTGPDAETTGFGDWPAFFRTFGLVFILTALLGLYVQQYELRLLKNYSQAASFFAILLLMQLLVQVIIFLNISPYLIVVPTLIVAIVVNIAYAQRFALAIGGYFTVLSVLKLPMTVSFAEGFTMLVGICSAMFITVLCLREIRTRSRIIQVSVLAGIVIFAMVWFMGYLHSGETREMLRHSLCGLLGAIGAGFFVQGMLPVIEWLFHTATSMRLLDYSEANKPLLQRLAVEAPGTFHHSWQIGMLAESAAEAIGGNGLLCRVGSYYHDIGKLNKPQFFVENQGEKYSQHTDLSPTMSKMIIIGHVKDGLAMAQEYKLPRVLHQFIATHHGTTLVEFFYHTAMKAEEENGQTINEADFRYPGPKPHTKETAIVMICDAVEGATRALAEPTPSRIEQVVNKLVMKRLLDGQFDECNLTMCELRQIEDRIISTLCGMYHGRIAYPQTESKKEEKMKKKQNQPSETSTEKETQRVGTHSN